MSNVTQMNLDQDLLYLFEVIHNGELIGASKIGSSEVFESFTGPDGIPVLYDIYKTNILSSKSSYLAIEMIEKELMKSGSDLKSEFHKIFSWLYEIDADQVKEMHPHQLILRIIECPKVSEIKKFSTSRNLDFFLQLFSIDQLKSCRNPEEAFSRLHRITGDKNLLKFTSRDYRGTALEDGLGL